MYNLEKPGLHREKGGAVDPEVLSDEIFQTKLQSVKQKHETQTGSDTELLSQIYVSLAD